jgi:putative endonuclease
MSPRFPIGVATTYNAFSMSGILAQSKGAAGEQLAADYLQGRGLRLIERNFRVRGGEIDLVCRDGRTTVFVEVRLRSRGRFRRRRCQHHRAKQARLILAARHWLLRHGETPCRFDCVLLDGLDPPKTSNGCAMRFRLTSLLRLAGLAVSLGALAAEVRILVQSSPLAGFQYHAGEALWQEMREGDRLAPGARSRQPA